MSARHAWLSFVATGPRRPLTLRPDDPRWQPDAATWQSRLTELHRRWYTGVAPPQVAAVFVLQWLLQVAAHTAAHAAASGPWRADLGDLTFSLGPALVPATVRLTTLTADDGGLGARLGRAEVDYRAAVEPVAAAYPAQVRVGPHARAALVDDMWMLAAREAEGAAGVIRPGAPARASCCLIYALPGCVECAGCPRLR